jgi:hypothetical protein
MAVQQSPLVGEYLVYGPILRHALLLAAALVALVVIAFYFFTPRPPKG